MSWQPGDSQQQATRREELPGRYDATLLLSALALAAFGLMMVGSSSIAIAEGEGSGPFHYLLRHALFLGMGAMLGLAMMRTPLDLLERHSRVLMLAAVLLLLAVFVPGLGRRINAPRHRHLHAIDHVGRGVDQALNCHPTSRRSRRAPQRRCVKN